MIDMAGDMVDRPRLLFLCQTLPYPPDGGVSIRTYNILRLLSHEFAVTALCFYRHRIKPTEESVAAGVGGLNRVGRTEAFPIPQETSRIRFAWDHLRSVIRRRPYTVFAYESDAFAHRLDELLRGQDFDLVHVDSMDLSGYLPMVEHLPVVCAHHNVESELLRRRAEVEPAGLRRWYVRAQAGLMEREERRWCERVALNTAVSADDLATLRALAPRARHIVVPNGVDTNYFTPGDTKQEGIVFVGGHSWFPNRDGLDFFAAEILPLIRRRCGEVPVKWVGRAPSAVADRFRSEGIDVTGYVDDIRPHVRGAAVFVVPLRVGGGTRLKILDAWAMGKAVVSTSIGCEGLETGDGRNILVRDDPARFADAVALLLRDDELRRSMGAEARSTAERTYSWDVIGAAMMPHYLGFTAERSADAGAESR